MLAYSRTTKSCAYKPLGPLFLAHPLMEMINSNLDIRKYQLVTSSKTGGILAINRNQVVTLSVPHLAYAQIKEAVSNLFS